MDTANTQVAVAFESNGGVAAGAPDEIAFRAIMLDAIAIFSVTDTKGVILEVNDKFCEISGFSRGELIGRDHRMLKSGVHPAETFRTMYRTIARGKVWRGELCNRTKSGRLYWVDSTIIPRLNSAGKVTGYVSARIDITARKRAEDSLRHSETLLRSTFAALSEGVVVQDAGGRIISCNPAAERILGIERGALSGLKSTDPRWRAIHEDGRAFAGDDHPAMVALATGAPQSEVIMGLPRPDCPTTWISVNSQPIFRDGGAMPSTVVTSFSDITARKLAQETLNEAVAAIPEGLVVYDSNDRLVLCNEAYKQVYAASAAAIQPGASFTDVLRCGLANGQYPEAGTSVEQQQTWFEERLRQHRANSLEAIQQLPDGRWLQIRERRTPSGFIVGFRTDVTELKQQAAKVQAMIDNFPGGILFFDADLRLIAGNDRYRAMLDQPDEQFEHGHTTLEMMLRANAERGEFGPGDRDEQVRSRMEHVRNATGVVFERVRPNGTVLEVHGTPIQGGGYIFAYLDITARHHAQEQLAESERNARAQSENLQMTLATMSQGLSLFDGDGRLQVWNDRYIEIFGLPQEEVKQGIHITALLALSPLCDRLDVDSDALSDQVRQHLTDSGLWRSTFHLNDGSLIQVVRTAVAGGGWLAIHEDITDKHHAESRLRETADELARINMRFEAALTHMSQGICLFDADKALVISNKRFRDIYGLSEEQVTPGTPADHLLRRMPVDVASTEQTIADQVDSLRERREEICHLSDGRIVQIRRRPTPDGGWVATHEDITERERADQRINHLAYHDALTGLANRVEFKRQGEAALARTAAANGWISVLLIDLDRFKAINDTFGHAAGDELLITVTERMRQSVRTNDVVARLGGDEFAILQDQAADQREASISLAARLVDVLGAPFDLGGHQAMIGASIGIAVQSVRGDTIEQLMHKADLALYRVKGAGRNGYRIYEDGIGSEEQERLRLGNELRVALASGALDVRYEPVVSLSDQSVCGMEAKIHWIHPTRGPLDPSDFLHVAEESGLTVPLGEFLLRRACLDAGHWPDNIIVTVGVAALHLKKRLLMDTVTRALLKARMPPERLNIAITETALLRYDEDVLAELHQLRSLGVAVVIDGYGAANASLNQLRVFPFDRIKIDRSMVADITERPETAAIVCAVTGLARSLDILTTAEGVDTEEQYRMLQAAGCSQGQGGLFGPAATATETLSRLLIEADLPERTGMDKLSRGVQ